MSAEKLQACLDRIARGETVESVLQELQADTETRALVHLALAAGDALPVVAPSPMRARQQAALQEMMAAQAAPSSTGPGAALPIAWRRVLVRFAGLAMAASLALGSAVAVSAESLPGDTLYGVKRAAETARVALTVAPIARAKLRSSLAVERLAELRALVDRGVMPSPEDLERLLTAHAALKRDAALAGEDDLVTAANRQSEELATALRAMASDLAETDPAAADRLDAAAASVVPPTPSVEQPESGGGEGRDGDAGQGAEDGGASAGAQDQAPTRSAPEDDAETPVAQASPTRVALSSATPALALDTATPTGLPSATPRPVASATTASSGGAGSQPTAQPVATEPAPPTAPPAPSAVPPTSVPPTTAPPDPTSEPSIPNPRGTERAATKTAGTASP